MASVASLSPAARASAPMARLKRFLARRWGIALLVFVVLLAGIFASGLLKPEYDGQMKILVRRHRMDALITPQANITPQITEGLVTEEDLNSEVEVLNSEELLRRVAMQSGLVPDGNVNGRGKQQEIARAVRQLSAHLAIEPIRKTDVISVHYRSHDPQLTTDVLRNLASAYLAKHLELERPAGEAEFFNQQKERYHRDLEQIQSQMREFAAEHGVVAAAAERDFALQRMNTFTANAADAEQRARELEQRVETLRSKLSQADPRILTLQRSADNPQLQQQLKTTLLNLGLKRIELLTKFQADYPLVKEVDHQIAQAQAAIVAEANTPLQDQTTDRNPEYAWEREELTRAETELAGIRARRQSALQLARTSQLQGSKLDGLSFEQQGLRDQEKTDEENYLLYERKTEEAKVSDALDLRGILNVGVAEQPVTPALPTHGLFLFPVLALALAALISLSFAYLLDVFSGHTPLPSRDAVIGTTEPVRESYP